MYTIGVDIGATNTKLVLIHPVKSFRKNSERLVKQGFNRVKILKKKQIATPQTKGELVKLLKEEIKNLINDLSKKNIKGIGLGVPSPLNEKRDFILNSPNLKCLTNFPLAKIVEKDLKIKTIMENDANCFALAEAVMGAGQGAGIVVGITLGTGVGGGLIQDDKLIIGAFGSAGEFSRIIINFDSKFNILTEYCSEKFFKRKNLYSKTLDNRAKGGDKKARKVFEEYGRYLGIGLANIINILDPETIVIGGGISKAHKFFLPTTKKEVSKRILSPLSKKFVKIKVAKLKDFSGAIGAGLIFYYGK